LARAPKRLTSQRASHEHDSSQRAILPATRNRRLGQFFSRPRFSTAFLRWSSCRAASIHAPPPLSRAGARRPLSPPSARRRPGAKLELIGRLHVASLRAPPPMCQAGARQPPPSARRRPRAEQELADRRRAASRCVSPPPS
jgi:hypothetical protein